MFDDDQWSSTSYGGLIEKIEILRSTLRWASALDRLEIQRLLRQCNELRDEVILLSRKERIEKAASREESPAAVGSAPQRRKALLERNFTFEGIFGENPKLLETLEIAEKAAPSDLPVLIDGESGTGKELLARVIHTNSRRADQPFISVNCGALPGELLEAELFGHVKGAFTGAAKDRRGKFESAHKGTIFLDEIGELPLPGQVKLLRVLQSHEIQRVGSDEVLKVDTRVVAATNQCLLKMAQERQFREDLFYRLSVIHVTLPSLRERADEIPLLIDYFCDEAAEKLQRPPVKMAPRLRQFLLTYSYPGNIRELRNIIFRLSCLADTSADLAHLPETIRPATPTSGEPPAKGHERSLSLNQAKKRASDEAERRFLEESLREVKGNVAELARRIGLNRSHLQTLLKKQGLHSKDFRVKS